MIERALGQERSCGRERKIEKDREIRVREIEREVSLCFYPHTQIEWEEFRSEAFLLRKHMCVTLIFQ